MPPLTILLVTMNRRDLLEIALWFIYETSNANERDLWIWDNASEDDTSDFLGTLVGWPGVRVFRSRENLGLVGPRKRMLPYIKTPYVFTLDDDVWIMSRGWASAVARVLDGDHSIGQLALAQGDVHSTNGYGVVHEKLDRPFFRVPPIWPRSKRTSEEVLRDPLPGHVDLHGRPPSMVGSHVGHVGGEQVFLPSKGTQLPFAVSGSCAAWRTADLLPLIEKTERHPVIDLREAWGFSLQERLGRREGLLPAYGMYHPCPGPLWHLGRGEKHWETRCQMAKAVYGRSAEEQRSWLERAREGSGWGRSLEDPSVLGSSS